MKRGILIVNLGSPRSPTVPAVKSFLREFLMDPYVIDIPYIARWILVNGIICTFRPKSVVPKYKSIWTKYGSPLVYNTYNLKTKLEEKLGDNFAVEIGMRYGSPSIKQALESFAERNIQDITVFQMYPQQAMSTTTSNESLINKLAKDLKLNIRYTPPFYQSDGFINCLAEIAKEVLQDKKWQHFIISYHGIPKRHTTKQSQNPKCGTPGCCDKFEIQNCYKAQCEQTSRLLAKKLGLTRDQYTVSFQSRLNKNWIEPFTDKILVEYAQKGIRDIAIISPSFVADCLETVQELQLQERDRFSSAGGHSFTYIPCLNDRASWVDEVAKMIVGSIAR